MWGGGAQQLLNAPYAQRNTTLNLTPALTSAEPAEGISAWASLLVSFAAYYTEVRASHGMTTYIGIEIAADLV